MHIENRLHYVRDFTYDEDRCRAYVRHLPRNLACLTNAAISLEFIEEIVRVGEVLDAWPPLRHIHLVHPGPASATRYASGVLIL